MFTHDTFAAIFGAVRAGETEVLTPLVRAALREGYALVLNEPGTKKPLCTLTATARKAADRAAQDAAAERGDPNAAKTRHACGVHHALTEADAGKVTALITRLTKTYGGPPNVGIEPGRSRMIAVDVDTAAERDAFLASWREEEPDLPAPGFTVLSPGARRDDGSWAHSEGGHYWFRLPAGVELPAGHGVLKDESGWTAAWRDRQILVPPSVRAEGPYVCVGQPAPAPAWLTDRIYRFAEGREERERIRLEAQAVRRESGAVDPVDAWSEDTPWSALLEPDGWTATGLVDTCSCPTWTAPGPHGSPKSATAHDVGCTRFDSDDGHAPLHVWTDNPPDYLVDALARHGRTLTKLTYCAWRDHGGDESAAVIGLGLAVREGGPMEVDDPFDLGEPARVQEQSTTSPHTGGTDKNAESDNPSRDHHSQSQSLEGLSDEFEAAGEEQDEEATAARVDPAAPESTGLLRVLTSSQLREQPDPDPLIFGMLDRGTVAILAGKYGTYKSFLALDWACHVATGQAWQGHPVDQATSVVYIAAEGEVGIKRRVRGWEQRHRDGEPLPDEAFAAIPHRVVLETDKDGKATAHLRELVALVNARGAGLVVFDTLSKSRGKAEENSNSDMSALMALVIELTRATKATVLLVAHTGYAGEHTRGGSSQEDDVDTVFVIKFEDPRSEDRGIESRRVLHHSKAKDGELSPPRVLVPRVEELGRDSHGRPITTLTLSADPWEAATGPRQVASVESVLEELERLNAPKGLSQRKFAEWRKGLDLAKDSHLRTRTATWWPVYAGEYSASDSQDRESLDMGITPDQQE